MPYLNDIPILPTRVICIDQDEKIPPYLHLSQKARHHYFTLSYCWGKTQKGVLKIDVYDQYLNTTPLKTGSKTLQDAIKVTRALGGKYLWIDAICIIQDSDDDKNKELAIMGDIYRNSALTIAAGVGADTECGLFAIRDPREYRPYPIFKKRIGLQPPTQIFAARPRQDFHRTPLGSRAWVFQEDILATRTLSLAQTS
jgi:hypothetical protein